MNNLKKEAALRKYQPLLTTNTKEQILDMLNADEKEYTSTEVLEIMEALNAEPGPAAGSQGPGEPGENKGSIGPGPDTQTLNTTPPPPPEPPKEEPKKPATLNKVYEEWKVKAKYEKQRGDDGTMRNVYVGCEKDAKDPIRTTSITPERAKQVNEQTENTLIHLYLAEEQEDK